MMKTNSQNTPDSLPLHSAPRGWELAAALLVIVAIMIVLMFACAPL